MTCVEPRWGGGGAGGGVQGADCAQGCGAHADGAGAHAGAAYAVGGACGARAASGGANGEGASGGANGEGGSGWVMRASMGFDGLARGSFVPASPVPLGSTLEPARDYQPRT